jgi:hypothetical protein
LRKDDAEQRFLNWGPWIEFRESMNLDGKKICNFIFVNL